MQNLSTDLKSTDRIDRKDLESTDLIRQVTVIITTSPIPSHPSTIVLETILASLSLLNYHFEEYIIVFDGYSISPTDALKSGQVTNDLVARYEEYKTNVCSLMNDMFSVKEDIVQDEWEYYLRKDSIKIKQQTLKSHQGQIKLLHVTERAIGFANAVHAALTLTRTDLVLVMQHDWKFTSEIPFTELVKEFRSAREMKYLTFSTKHKIQVLDQIDQTYSKDIKRLLSWYDRNHLAKSMEYLNIYRNFRFKRGYFIEDTFGQYYLNYLKESKNQEDFLKRHAELGTFIYDPKDIICQRHMNGRRLIKDLYFK